MSPVGDKVNKITFLDDSEHTTSQIIVCDALLKEHRSLPTN